VSLAVHGRLRLAHLFEERRLHFGVVK
jgi:hypothetical protein